MGFSDGSELIAADYFRKWPDQKETYGPFLRDIKTQPWVYFVGKG